MNLIRTTGWVLIAGFMVASAEPIGQEPETAGIAIKVLDADRQGKILLDLTYPRSPEAGEGELTVEIAGKPVPSEPKGGGSSGGMITRTILVSPGAPGEKELTITLKRGGETLQGRIKVDFQPKGSIEPDWVSDQLFTEPSWLRLIVRRVEGFQAKVNGTVARHGFEKRIMDDLYTQSVVVEDPPLKPGRNVIELTGRDQRGRPVEVTAPLYYAPGGKVKTGDSFTLVYGKEGSRSGPFYSVKIEGEAIVDAGKVELGEADKRLVCTLKAAHPGTATVRIYKKPHFREPEELERTISLTVE